MKRRTPADAQRIKDEVRQAMAEPRSSIEFPGPAIGLALKSECCGVRVQIEADSSEGCSATNCYVCTKCGRPCDAKQEALFAHLRR
jgi:hypothetical protein